MTNVVLSFKEARLGNEHTTFVCMNPGGQCPNAASKKTVTTERPPQATFRPENGQVTASLMLIPPPRPNFCPSGQTEQLAEISFTNIQIMGLTNNVSKTATPLRPRRCCSRVSKLVPVGSLEGRAGTAPAPSAAFRRAGRGRCDVWRSLRKGRSLTPCISRHRITGAILRHATETPSTPVAARWALVIITLAAQAPPRPPPLR
jgi:hypothetical protein